MKTFLKCLLLGMAVLPAAAQTPDLFRPYKASDLRMPSVPLIVSDPYFSIWSPYDNLTDGCPAHWTADEKPIDGMLRVDGVTYRFMGAKHTVFETVVPMGIEEAWEGKYTMTTPGAGWEKPDYNDSDWKSGKGAFGSQGNSGIHTDWSAENSDIFVRREINLTPADLEGDLYLVYSHDDNFDLYLNGTRVAQGPAELKEEVRLELTPEIRKLLHPGKNVIASYCHNNGGGALTDYGIFRNIGLEDSNTPKAVQKSVDVMATST